MAQQRASANSHVENINIFSSNYKNNEFSTVLGTSTWANFRQNKLFPTQTNQKLQLCLNTDVVDININNMVNKQITKNLRGRIFRVNCFK